MEKGDLGMASLVNQMRADSPVPMGRDFFNMAHMYDLEQLRYALVILLIRDGVKRKKACFLAGIYPNNDNFRRIRRIEAFMETGAHVEEY